MASGLIGPPSLRRDPTKPLPSTTPDQFISLLDAGFGANPQSASAENDEPLMGLTENGSATFLSSGNPCVDFFFQVVPSTPSFTVFALLSAAWDHDPLIALKLLCHLRGVRGTGKSDKEGFYAGAMWLHRNHPKTLALNAASFAEFGYMKDLLEILFRVVHGDNIREEMKKEREEMMKERAEMMKEREEPPSSKKPVPRSKKRSHRRHGVRILKLKCACLPDLPKKTTLADFIAAMMASVLYLISFDYFFCLSI